MALHDYWYKQSAAEPLFPDLVWGRPENRSLAGKLLIIGGNAYGFSAPAQAFQEATTAGVGFARVLLPDALRQTVGHQFFAGEFAPSTPSGSFSQQALAEFLTAASWADAVLIAGDLGRNSETAIALERFIETYHGQLTITKDALDYFTASPRPLLLRPETTLVLSFAQLQRTATHTGFTRPFTFDMGLLQLVENLHLFTERYQINIIVKHLQTMIAAKDGVVSTSKLEQDKAIWRVATAAHASVWWLQNPRKPFEALTTAIHSTERRQE